MSEHQPRSQCPLCPDQLCGHGQIFQLSIPQFPPLQNEGKNLFLSASGVRLNQNDRGRDLVYSAHLITRSLIFGAKMPSGPEGQQRLRWPGGPCPALGLSFSICSGGLGNPALP